jgi:DNA polymerase III epsilon subunit-like protein
MFAAIDVETTGRLAGFHEIVQIAIVPVHGQPFHRFIKPKHPERMESGALATHKITIESLADEPDAETVADWLHEWAEPFGRVTLIAHNWAFEAAYLMNWLGCDQFNWLFAAHARCTLQLALAINDRNSPPPFRRLGLSSLCRQLDIRLDRPHNALYDAYAGLEVYKRLVAL